MHGFLLARDAVPAQPPRQGTDRVVDAPAVAQFREGGVGLFPDELQEPLGGGGVQFRGGTPAVGLGLDRSGGTPPLQQSDEEGEIDAEQVGNLAEREVMAIHGSDDALAKVVGIRTQRSTSTRLTPRSHSLPYVNRRRTALGSGNEPRGEIWHESG